MYLFDHVLIVSCVMWIIYFVLNLTFVIPSDSGSNKNGGELLFGSCYSDNGLFIMRYMIAQDRLSMVTYDKRMSSKKRPLSM